MAQRSAMLHDIYASDIADAEAGRYQKALEEVAADTTYLPYQGVKVIVKDWQGVQVAGDHATVQFVSQFEYSGKGQGRKPDFAGAVQWQMTLVRQGDAPYGGWRIESEKGLPLVSS